MPTAVVMTSPKPRLFHSSQLLEASQSPQRELQSLIYTEQESKVLVSVIAEQGLEKLLIILKFLWTGRAKDGVRRALWLWHFVYCLARQQTGGEWAMSNVRDRSGYCYRPIWADGLCLQHNFSVVIGRQPRGEF